MHHHNPPAPSIRRTPRTDVDRSRSSKASQRRASVASCWRHSTIARWSVPPRLAFIPTVVVPALLVTLAMVFAKLVPHRR